MKRTLIPSLILVFAHLAFGDIVSYLRFEENGGSVAHDVTGLLDGEFNSFMPTEPSGGDSGFRGWSSDVSLSVIPLTGAANNGSIRFAGGSEYIDLSNYNDLLLGTAFTIEMFMKPDDIAAQYGASIFGLGSDFSDRLFFAIGNDSGQSTFRVQFMDTQYFFATDDILYNEWQHVALVVESGEYSVYLNGQLLHNENSLGGSYEFYGDPTLGTRTIGGESGTFRGYLDEFRISDTALTPDQFLIVPEPGTMGLLGLGGLALLAMRRGRVIRKSLHS